jgi:hypothetical protein
VIGVYDFCGHYEWTFAWLETEGGEELVRQCWREAVGEDAQRHASELIRTKGIAGMKEYWNHSLCSEAAGFTTSTTETLFRLDIHDCPSKGFLLHNGLEQYPDYCDHCIGWIGHVMKQAGFVLDHEHNHCGQCWWEFRHSDDLSQAGAPGEVSGDQDVRLSDNWNQSDRQRDLFVRTNGVEDKQRS